MAMRRFYQAGHHMAEKAAKCPEPLCPTSALPTLGRCVPSPRKALPLLHCSYGLMCHSLGSLLLRHLTSAKSLCRLYAVPAAHGSFPTLSLKVLPWMLDPVPRRYTVIAVGTVITDRPPHRSVRAQLRHTAPTLGADGKANAWPRMKDFGLREKVIGRPLHPLPREAVLLTAAPQRAQPEALDMVDEGVECRKVGRHGIVGKVAPNDLRQPTPLFGDRLVHSPP